MGRNTQATATDIDDVQTDVQTAAAPVTRVSLPDVGAELSGKEMEVTIQPGLDEAGKQAAFIGINGHGLLVPRGIPVRLPVEVVEILKNATMEIYEREGDRMVPREVQRYSFMAMPVVD